MQTGLSHKNGAEMGLERTGRQAKQAAKTHGIRKKYSAGYPDPLRKNASGKVPIFINAS